MIAIATAHNLLNNAGFGVTLRRDMDGRVVVMVATSDMEQVRLHVRNLSGGYEIDRVGDAVRVAAR